MAKADAVEKIIEEHKNSGKFFEVNDLRCFALDEGKGEAVFCIHGVPTSSYLYRKLIPEIAKRGFRGIAVDLPGFGFSDRPKDFDYSFPSLASFCDDSAKALGLEKYHLLVHDVGGPVGFALAADNKENILSLTILNTWIDVVNFKKPLPMRPFEKKILGEAQLAALQHPTWYLMFTQLGINNNSEIPKEEIYAYVDLLKREDGGKAFLKLMRNFDHSPEFRDKCYHAVKNVQYPVQAIWGEDDPALTLDRYGKEIKDVAGLKEIQTVSSRHFLQEEKSVEIAEKIKSFIRSAV